MDIEQIWEKAIKHTEIIRSRVMPLATFHATELPYIFLAESDVNIGDTVIRKGRVCVEKPSIVLPGNLPQFEGFEFEKDYSIGYDMLTTFLLVRGVRFPSLKYSNQVCELDIYEGSLQKAIDQYNNLLQRTEDVHSGLIIGPEDCWQFSVLIFVCGLVASSANEDIKRILNDFRKRHNRE